MSRKFHVLLVAVMVIFCSQVSSAKVPEVFKLGVMTSFTGPFSKVAETQKMGVLLKVDQINRKGGLNMPWGKVRIEAVLRDDKMDIETGVKLFHEMVEQEGIHALVGSIYSPMSVALNEACKQTNTPYLPGCVPGMDAFKKGNPAAGTFSVAFTPWSIGYLTGGCIMKTLGTKKIWFVSRTDEWGTDTLKGLEKAAETFGGNIVGVSHAEKGRKDYREFVQSAKASDAQAFATCMFASDAVANLTQAYKAKLHEKALIFNTWITGVVASEIPDEALSNLYALIYHYYNLEAFEDRELASIAKEYSQEHIAMWNQPPDAYGTIMYLASDILFQAVEKAGSFDSKPIVNVLANSRFNTLKGEVYFRQDQQMVSRYMAFLVRGKSADERENPFDLFDVMGYFGGEESLPTLESLGY